MQNGMQNVTNKLNSITNDKYYHIDRIGAEKEPTKEVFNRNKDADIENGLEDTGRGKGKLGRSERVAWTYIHYQM